MQPAMQLSAINSTCKAASGSPLGVKLSYLNPGPWTLPASGWG